MRTYIIVLGIILKVYDRLWFSWHVGGASIKYSVEKVISGAKINFIFNG
jgi:ABC-type uncharacterized transport system permease subunit